MSVDAETKYTKLDFDPLQRAESMMAKAAVMPYKDGAAEATIQREAVRDLLLLDIAKSLRQLLHAQQPVLPLGGQHAAPLHKYEFVMGPPQPTTIVSLCSMCGNRHQPHEQCEWKFGP